MIGVLNGVNMPDDFGSCDEEVIRRIKMAQNVNPRPRVKAGKPIATVNIVGSITDPANIAKIKAAYEEVMVRPTHPPAPIYQQPPPLQKKITEFFDEQEYIDEETELTKEIEEAARKAGILPRENLPKPSPPKNVVIKGSGWMGPG